MSDRRNDDLKRRPAPPLPSAEPLPSCVLPSAEVCRRSGTPLFASPVLDGATSTHARGDVGDRGKGPWGDARRPARVVSSAVVRDGDVSRGGVGAPGGGPRGDAGRPVRAVSDAARVVSGAEVCGGVALHGGACSGEDRRTQNTRDIGTWSSSSESRIARCRLRVVSSAPMFKAPPVRRRLPCPSRWEAPSSRGRFPAALLLLRAASRSGLSSSSSLSPNRSALRLRSAARGASLAIDPGRPRVIRYV
jgi:hypothetical protein